MPATSTVLHYSTCWCPLGAAGGIPHFTLNFCGCGPCPYFIFIYPSKYIQLYTYGPWVLKVTYENSCGTPTSLAPNLRHPQNDPTSSFPSKLHPQGKIAGVLGSMSISARDISRCTMSWRANKPQESQVLNTKQHVPIPGMRLRLPRRRNRSSPKAFSAASRGSHLGEPFPHHALGFFSSLLLPGEVPEVQSGGSGCMAGGGLGLSRFFHVSMSQIPNEPSPSEKLCETYCTYKVSEGLPKIPPSQLRFVSQANPGMFARHYARVLHHQWFPMLLTMTCTSVRALAP